MGPESGGDAEVPYAMGSHVGRCLLGGSGRRRLGRGGLKS